MLQCIDDVEVAMTWLSVTFQGYLVHRVCVCVCASFWEGDGCGQCVVFSVLARQLCSVSYHASITLYLLGPLYSWLM